MTRRTRNLSIVTALSSDILLLILDNLHEPNDRKSWRLVCVNFRQVELLHRKSLTVLRQDYLIPSLKRYMSLQHIDLSKCPNVDDRTMFSAFGRRVASTPSSSSLGHLRSVDLSRANAVRWRGLEVLVGGCAGLKSVNLSYCCGVGDLEMAAVAKAGGLRELTVTKCLGVTDVGLARAAIGCSGLVKLGLKWCLEISDIGIDLLTKKCRELNDLDISYLKVTNASLRSISSLEKLENLCVMGCPYVNDDGLSYLSNGRNSLKSFDASRCNNVSSLGISSVIRHHSSIEKLVVGYCHSVVASPFLLKLRDVGKSLKAIELGGFHVSVSILQAVGQSCKSLVEIGLSKCSGVTDEGISDLVSCCSNLRKLDLTCCHLITDGALFALAKSCVKLTSLQLESCSLITEKGLERIGAFCDNLQDLDLTDCCVNDKGLEFLSRCSQLLNLKLGLCLGITDKGLSFIASNCRRLQLLDLYRCTGIGEDGLSCIAQGCKNLKKLNICYCENISDKGLKNLCVLQELLELEMRKLNKVTSAGISAIAIGCRNLVKLDLKQCDAVDDMGFWALAHFSEKIRQINLSRCSITDLSLLMLLGNLRCLQDAKLVQLPLVSVEGFENALKASRNRLKKVKLLSGLRCLFNPTIIKTMQNRGCRFRWVDKPLKTYRRSEVLYQQLMFINANNG